MHDADGAPRPQTGPPGEGVAGPASLLPQPGLLERAWALAVRHPLVALTLIVALQTVPAIGTRDFWLHDEVRHADVLRHAYETGQYTVLTLNGVPYPDKPPLYFLLLGGLKALTQASDAVVVQLGSGLSGLLLAWAVYALARAGAGLSREGGLAAGLAIAATPLFAVLTRTTRMDALFAACVTASQAALFAGWQRPAASRWVVLGLGLAGLACLVKGPFGLALPLATSLMHLAWVGRLRRLLCRDVALGAALAVLLVGGWLAAVVHVAGWDYLKVVLGDQVLRRALNAVNHREVFWFYMPLVPLIALPWTLMLVTWRPRRTGPGLWARARAAAPQTAYPWILMLGGFVLLSLTSTKAWFYLLPLLAPLAVLVARALAAMEPRRAAWLWIALALFSVGGAVALPLAARASPFPGEVSGVPECTAWMAATGVALFLARRRRPLPVLGLAALLGAGTVMLVSTRVLPSIDAGMSPRDLAREVMTYVDAGYEPVLLRAYPPGLLAYHGRRAFLETSDRTLFRSVRASHPRLVVVTTEKYRAKLADVLEGLTVVRERRVFETVYVVLASEPLPAAAGGGTAPGPR